MAADVRESDEGTLTSPPPPASPCESETSLCSRGSLSSLPSYLIVHKQMQDVVLSQRAAVEQLIRTNIDVLNSSRESFSTTVQSQEDKIKVLEKTIIEDYVPKHLYESLKMKLKEDYVPKTALENLQQQLEQEYQRHSETEMKLQDVLVKLDSSLTQVAVLQSQMEQDKTTFSTACDSLKEELSAALAQNKELETRLSGQLALSQKQQEQILQQEGHIESLNQKQKQQMLKYQQVVTAAEVEKQQEAYLSKMLNDTRKKR